MWVRYLVFLGIVVLVAAIVLGVQRLQRRLSTEGGDEAATAAAHEASVRRARRQLRKAEREHAKAIVRAEKAVTKASMDAPLVSVGPVVLRPLSITLRGTEHLLSAQTRFDVDVVGEIVSMVKDGKAVTDDRREVFLTVKDPAWGDVVKLRPGQLEGVRRLVVAGEIACRNLDEARRARRARVAVAEADLERVRADTGAVDAARMTVEDLEGAPPRPLEPLDQPSLAQPPLDPSTRSGTPHTDEEPDQPDVPDDPGDPGDPDHRGDAGTTGRSS